MTQETDQDQRRRINEMEKDLASFDEVEGDFFLYSIMTALFNTGHSQHNIKQP
jgi:hypothetical protein